MTALTISAFTARQNSYGSAMTNYFRIAATVVVGSVMLLSCGNDKDLIALAGNTQAVAGAGDALYQQAKAADNSGKQKKALKLYGKVADDYPTAPSAAEARFRQAEILEQRGEILDSFDAYQKFLTRYRGSGLYSKALSRQATMAQAAADGEVKSSFVGLKRKLSTDKVVVMLSELRDNAPRTKTSARAQFTIGQLYEGEKDRANAKKAIGAYRKLVRDQPESSYAPEALFRVGVVFMDEADRGNRNQSTLDLADEAFSDYLLQYPGHSKNAEARRFSKNLRSRELDRSLEIAEYYDRTGQIESAKIYYRDVVKQTKSGASHDKAQARLRQLGE